MNNSSTYCLIMAGGVGSRFWPLSTEENPKQFLDILGTGKSLIQLTFDRFNQIIPEENIYVLTNKDYKSKVIEQLGIDSDQVLCEPQRKNTAPCIAYATAKIHKKDSNAVLLVSPADHLIINEAQFFKDLKTGIEKAQHSNNLVTFGIKPNRPDTGYGYIEFDASEGSMNSVATVKQFREKPDYDTAKQFLAQGNFLWNAGIFMWSATAVIKAFKTNQPELFEHFYKGIETYNTDAEAEFIEENYAKAENISVDYAIMLSLIHI